MSFSAVAARGRAGASLSEARGGDAQTDLEGDGNLGLGGVGCLGGLQRGGGAAALLNTLLHVFCIAKAN